MGQKPYPNVNFCPSDIFCRCVGIFCRHRLMFRTLVHLSAKRAGCRTSFWCRIFPSAQKFKQRIPQQRGLQPQIAGLGLRVWTQNLESESGNRTQDCLLRVRHMSKYGQHGCENISPTQQVNFLSTSGRALPPVLQKDILPAFARKILWQATDSCQFCFLSSFAMSTDKG